jgi:hypothetical protein
VGHSLDGFRLPINSSKKKLGKDLADEVSLKRVFWEALSEVYGRSS